MFIKKWITLFPGLFFFCLVSYAQQKATIREYTKFFTTYPFSDPDPVPQFGKIYPYYRFDGYTDKPVQKQWKVVELENDYLKIMILPEVGGKIWAAIEKSTGKPFIYYNHVVKFRDVAMRGPWTSGGIEANYGIIGHTPNCATPVDYTMVKKKDGSVSCVIGVLDLLTRTNWRIDINLPKDKAYFTTGSSWYNSSPFEQPYYTWMNTGIKASGNLQFIYPGTKYLGHNGEYSDWPVNKTNGKDISFYRNNNFGGYKSYHVFGKYTDFFGGYWHDEEFGMARYSRHDDKAGKKIWIWGLSQQGMIWDKLLSDTDGQYVEVQSGRLFNQSAPASTFTPFKHKGFLPHTTDTWTEYWFPVLKTKGFVAANNYGALNLEREGSWIKIYFSPVQDIHDTLKVAVGGKVMYTKFLQARTLRLFSDSFKLDAPSGSLSVIIGKNKLAYTESAYANVLDRPVNTPADFDWTSVYGLYLQGKENIRQRLYAAAEKNLKACLQKDPNYAPALTAYALILYRNMKYTEALAMAKKALSVDTYDDEANYYYGLINGKLNKTTDAKDGFDIAAMGTTYRSAAYTELAKLYVKENDLQVAAEYASKSIDFNRYAIDAYQLLAVIYRVQNNSGMANKILDTLLAYDPLNHFAAFEKHKLCNTPLSKQQFTGSIKNEMPQETFLELAVWYHNINRDNEAVEVLGFSPMNVEVRYWQAFLKNIPLDTLHLNPQLVFPFRPETAEVLNDLIKRNDHWLLKYHLALISENYNDMPTATSLFEQCGNLPDFAPFYAARANLYMQSDTTKALSDLEKAASLNENEWRYGRSQVNYYLATKQSGTALILATKYYKRFPDNYILGMLMAKTLLANKEFNLANKVLQNIRILPNEGATDGRLLYKEVQLMLALEEMKRNNYNSSLNYIAAARQWPDNLGVGKPYESDIDERLEDWLTYNNYLKLENAKAAQQQLDKILSFSRSTEGDNNESPVNNLITAWAMQKKGNAEAARKFLQDWADKPRGNDLARWAINIYNNTPADLPPASTANEDYRVLQQWMEIH